MDTRGGLPTEGTGNGRPPRAGDEHDVGVVGDDPLDRDDAGIGDEGLGAHDNTLSGGADDRRGLLSHSGAWTSVTKAVEEPISQSRIHKAVERQLTLLANCLTRDDTLSRFLPHQ